MIKQNPTYRVTIFPAPISQEEPFTIEYPITCKFNSRRGTFSQANRCTIELYNLKPETRKAIFKDALVGDLEEKNWKFIKLEAGWNDVLSVIFYGRILQAYSHKNGGQVDVITKIEGLPFDIFSSQCSYTFAAGTSYKEAYKTMASNLPNCEIGDTGSLNGTFKTQTTFDGNTLECMNTLSGGNTFVDNGLLHTLMSNEVRDVPVPLLTDSCGLLETPIRRQAILTIKTLFEPSLVVGQLLSIQSSIQPEYSGQYKVLGFTHDCVFSPSQAGQRITTIDLWAIPNLVRSDLNITNEEITGGAAPVNAYKVKGDEVTPVTSTTVNPKWIMPVKNGRISSGYGNRLHPTLKEIKFHDGIDIAVPQNTPVKAVADGKVTRVLWNGGYGKYIEIEHANNINSFYGHLNSWNVSVGDEVTQGQIIAKSGNTAGKGKNGVIMTTGAHLHLGAKANGKSTNPLNYIKN